MVCAMQELTTSAVAITEHHHHHHHHHLHAAPQLTSYPQQQQLQHQQQHQQQHNQQQLEVRTTSLSNAPQFLTTTGAAVTGPPQPHQQQQPQQQQMTTIVVLTTPAAAAALANGNGGLMGGVAAASQQQYQLSANLLPPQQHKLTTNKSQQLKKQHASLVKLLESAPITKKVVNGQQGQPGQQMTKMMTQNTTSPVVQQQQQQQLQLQAQLQQHMVIPQQLQQQQLAHQQQQQQQIIYVQQQPQKPQQQQQQQHQTLAQQLAQPKRLKTNSTSSNTSVVATTTNNNNNTTTTSNNNSSSLSTSSATSSPSNLLSTLKQHLVVLPALTTSSSSSPSTTPVPASLTAAATTTSAASDSNNIRKTTLHMYNHNFSTMQQQQLKTSQTEQQQHMLPHQPQFKSDTESSIREILENGNEGSAGAVLKSHDVVVYEPQQCPWKKIRYARELKQKEQQQITKQKEETDLDSDELQQQVVDGVAVRQPENRQLCDKLAQNDKDKSNNTTSNNNTLTSNTTTSFNLNASIINNNNKELNLAEQTHKEIAILLQQQQQNYQQQQQQHHQQRRDSSDSNSSLISNTSSTHSLSNGCTCTPQQLQQRDSSDDDQMDYVHIKSRRSSLNLSTVAVAGCEDVNGVLCNCLNCHPHQVDMDDSGCDDDQKEEEQTTLNYLCQKFDENLETGKHHNNASATDLNEKDAILKTDIKMEEQVGEEEHEEVPSSAATGRGEATSKEQQKDKGFFRRSIQQKIQYRPCTKNQQCSILRINRNRCQYCRLKKCIAVGMSRDAVRFGRVPKREKARILAAMQQSTQNRGQQRALASELDDQPRLLSAVLRAHLDTCEFTKEKVAAMRQRARECPSYSMPTLLACPLNPAPELQSEQEFSQRFAHVIRGVIDFAGMIPGFQLLSQDDKFTLLKAGLFDALFVRLICMFDNSINSIICLNGQVMRRDAIQNGANARFLVDSTFNFAERMNSMNLTDAEIGLFCAIVLITPDRPGLRNIELIERMYNRLKGCLQTIINQNRPDQPEFMSKLLETMPDLRTLSTLHTEKLVVFRTEHKELLRQQMWSMDDDQQLLAKSPNSWDDHRMDVEAKSPLGSVSSTESGDLEYQTATTTTASHHISHHGQQTSSLASSAPLLAATLSGTCPLRNRANSGSSGDSTNELDIVGSHAHLTQNGLTITPIVRAHSHQQLHHHLTTAGTAQHRYRKLDSPTDSGIESGNEKNECGSKNVSSGGSSSCSSPRSSVDDALDCSENATAAASSSQVTVSVSPVRSPQPLTAAATSTSNSTSSSSSSLVSSAATSASNPAAVTLKRQIVDDMPVLKRVLQAPPLYDTNSLMDEAYKPHKKFRALRHREYDCGEGDASSSTNNVNATSTSSCIPAAASSPQLGNAHSPPPPSANQQQHMSPSVASTNSAQNSVLMVPQATHSPQTAPLVSSPPGIAQHQSQLHMHLTRPTPTNSNSGANHQQHQQQPSSLSSTHSVLAKSLMGEPRMTPEQMKRSDIIQNYIMRESSTASSSTNNLMVCSPHGPGSRSPAPGLVHSMHGLYPASNSPNSSSSPNSNCNSPSTTTVTALASPPVSGGRWPGHSVITTTTINQRQQSVSPSSNGSSSSSTSSSSSSTSSSSGCQYFQSPHSTSASVSPPRPSPTAMNTPPRLLELQVDIADSQQPLNLSKKSPTPPPSKLQALVAAATAAQRYPTVSADVTVTATNGGGSVVTAAAAASSVVNSSTPPQQHQVQKVMLEA